MEDIIEYWRDDAYIDHGEDVAVPGRLLGSVADPVAGSGALGPDL